LVVQQHAGVHRARSGRPLEAVPRTKQIGYYSDMYKLEFGLPKFAMFKRILAKVLAERFVIDRDWSEEQAVALGKQVCARNVETIFRWGENLRSELPDDNALEPLSVSSPLGPIPTAVTLEAERKSTPVIGESERLERLPQPPAKEFVLPASHGSADEELRLQGASPSSEAGDSGIELPELEVIEDVGEVKLDESLSANDSAHGINPKSLRAGGD